MSDSGAFSIDLYSPPDRENLVAGVHWMQEQVAEISCETGEPAIEIYAHSPGMPWRFSYEEFMRTMSEAHERLANRIGPF